MKYIVIIGASDLFDLVRSSLDQNEYTISGYFAPVPEERSIYQNHTHLGPDTEITKDAYKDTAFVVAVYDNERRRVMHNELVKAGRMRLTIVHPSSVVYPTARIGMGCIIGPQVTISTLAQLGQGAYVNYGALVGHDVTVGDFSFISPGARVLGGAEIGDCSLIGANAVVLSHVKIGRNVSISAGAVITRNVPDNTKVILQQKIRYLPNEA